MIQWTEAGGVDGSLDGAPPYPKNDVQNPRLSKQVATSLDIKVLVQRMNHDIDRLSRIDRPGKLPPCDPAKSSQPAEDQADRQKKD